LDRPRVHPQASQAGAGGCVRNRPAATTLHCPPLAEPAVKKRLLLLLVVALLTAFFGLGLHRQLDLDSLQAGMAQFAAWRDASPLLVAGAYFVLYVVVTALSLPGAAVMTLAGGALFGLGWGLVIVS